MVHLNIKKKEQPEMAAAIQAVPDLFQPYLQAEVHLPLSSLLPCSPLCKNKTNFLYTIK